MGTIPINEELLLATALLRRKCRSIFRRVPGGHYPEKRSAAAWHATNAENAGAIFGGCLDGNIPKNEELLLAIFCLLPSVLACSVFSVVQAFALLSPSSAALQPALPGIYRGLSAVIDAQLGQNVADVRLDGLLADTQALGNQLVAQALGEQTEHFVFALTQRFEQLRAGRRAVAQRFHQMTGNARMQYRLAARRQ